MKSSVGVIANSQSLKYAAYTINGKTRMDRTAEVKTGATVKSFVGLLEVQFAV